jgi:hypothetical protein
MGEKSLWQRKRSTTLAAIARVPLTVAGLWPVSLSVGRYPLRTAIFWHGRLPNLTKMAAFGLLTKKQPCWTPLDLGHVWWHIWKPSRLALIAVVPNLICFECQSIRGPYEQFGPYLLKKKSDPTSNSNISKTVNFCLLKKCDHRIAYYFVLLFHKSQHSSFIILSPIGKNRFLPQRSRSKVKVKMTTFPEMSRPYIGQTKLLGQTVLEIQISPQASVLSYAYLLSSLALRVHCGPPGLLRCLQAHLVLHLSPFLRQVGKLLNHRDKSWDSNGC